MYYPQQNRNTLMYDNFIGVHFVVEPHFNCFALYTTRYFEGA